MARKFLVTEVSDLCLGKPPLRSLPATATVADAVSALKRSGDINVSVWSCNHSDSKMTCNNVVICRCIGKICMVDVIAYLCKDENLSRLFEALQTSVLDLVPKVKGQIRHLESNSRKALMILHMIWCDETITAAITTLSAGDLMAYLDYTGRPEDLVHLVNMRLRERNLTGMLDLMDDYYNPSFSSSSSSSDEEFGMGKNGGMGRSYPGRRSEAIVWLWFR